MTNQSTELTANDYIHLQECLSLAKEALNNGDEPFGSILVNAENQVIARARNKANTLNVLAHPEIELAKWAIENLSLEQRRQTTMYTSGEHCPMCAAAHGWVALGSIVYLSSAKQLGEWLQEFDVKESPINFVSTNDILKNTQIKGPGNGDLLKEIKALHQQYNS